MDRPSLDIQPVPPNDEDDGKTIQKEHSQNGKPENTYPEITRIAIEIGHRDKISSKRNFRDSTLDPKSPAFDFRKWVENILGAASDVDLKRRRISVLLKKVNLMGAGNTEEKQENVASVLLWPFQIHRFWRRSTSKRILRNVDGVLRPGDMLLVLGKPGSGCSSLLKAIGGHLEWVSLEEDSILRYNGIPPKEMSRNFRGETVYNAEYDFHFPHLTVKQTLEFASSLRMPRNRVVGLSKEEHIRQITAVAMAMCGLTDAQDSKVGNDYVRGVSGGERKRVSIAEMVLARASVGCWDNSTRGLDSAIALKFVAHLKTTADLLHVSHVAALYQASDAIYGQFNKALVLYDGREIYFGPTAKAKAYFEEMGWLCEPRQATSDFLISVTNNTERKSRPGFEDSVPRSPDEFERAWHSSKEYEILREEMKNLEEEESKLSVEQTFRAARRAAQAKSMLSRSPYTVNLWDQFQACLKRAYQRSWNDKVPILTTLFGQVIMALVVGSLFYRISDGTDGFYSIGSVLFFVVLLNTVVSVTEIGTLYEQRPIIQKHTSYAFCHPSIENLAVLVLDIPIKLVTATCFNVTIYFLAGLRVESSAFFIFYLGAILVRFTMSSIFRTIGSITKRYYQALAIAGVLLLVTLNYTGFTLPRSNMHPWFEWIIWINPLAYAFEVLMVNEVNGIEYACASLIPDYPNMSNTGFVCPVPGAIVGKITVSGNAYVEKSFQYSYSHLWRNVGILFGFWVFFTATYLATSALNLSISGKPGAIRSLGKKLSRPSQHWNEAESRAGEESLEQDRIDGSGSMPRMVLGNTLFSWHNVTYDVKVGNGTRRLLDNISAWVKSGQLTALMGVSGAGKTTLLDFLARRLGSGMRSGNITLSGVDISLAAIDTLGYVPQEDILFPTATVRESLRLSALLRQPSSTTKAEKYRHVEEIVKILGMQDFTNVVIGSTESGLNMEQRKLVSIGVELAAKPQCLLFLDEPTSGLDSQSSLAIVALLRRLANSGIAILATIHQPSASLLQKFDRLIFLAKGGKPVYFGDIGPNSQSVVDYFMGNGARKCDASENPAEYLTEILASRADNPGDIDWARVWSNSEDRQLQDVERDRISADMSNHVAVFPTDGHRSPFEAPIYAQLLHTSIRVFQQHWRMPSYVFGKLFLGLLSSLFIGFSFYQSPNSMKGVQAVLFSIFMIAAILSSLLQQIMPRFIVNRSLYEIREGPSKTYSWVVLVLSNMIVELPYQIILGIVVYASYYYPVYGIQSSERQGIVLLYCIQYFLFATTLASMISAATPDAQTAATLATLMFSLGMLFNGVFQPPDAMPDFWLFMYYVSPFTYIIGGIAATGLHGKLITCSENELSVVEPPPNQTCGEYLRGYLNQHGGEVYNPSATSRCQYCSISSADEFLSGIEVSWKNRWRNFGIVWVYVGFNCFMALVFYYGFRVKKWKGGRGKEKAGDMFRQVWVWVLATLFGAVGRSRREENMYAADAEAQPEL